MTTLYLCEVPKEPVDKIVFSDKGSCIQPNRDNITVYDDDMFGSHPNSQGLCHALLEAINQGWFKPNVKSLELMSTILEDEGFLQRTSYPDHIDEEITLVDELFIH